MNRPSTLFTKTLLYHLWQEFKVRYRFKYVLPKVKEAVLDGIALDLSDLSLKIRNRILMGIYEGHEKRLCEDLLTPTDSVVEIGSAIGYIGLVCQKKLGIKSYVAFEANPATLQVLQANYRLNGVTPCAWNLALGPEEGSIELDVSTDFWENSVVQSTEGASKPGRTVRVPSAPFRTLLSRGPAQANVLIVDVEGAEQFINPDDIPAHVNKIIIELHPHIMGPEKTYDLIAGLIRIGFYVAREESGTLAFLRRKKTVEESPARRRPYSYRAEDALQPAEQAVG